MKILINHFYYQKLRININLIKLSYQIFIQFHIFNKSCLEDILNQIIVLLILYKFNNHISCRIFDNLPKFTEKARS